MDLCYEVLYRLTKRSLFRKAEEFGLEVGDRVVVDVEGRKDLGEVVWSGEKEDASDAEGPDGGVVVRKATPEDVRFFQSRHQKEVDALEVFSRKIVEHDLPMKPVEVEYEDDRSRITFYFTADHRVDFRALVRDLARIYRTRIELRQINLRQCVQRLGEYGTCGRPLCCTSFMRQLPTVPAQAAHAQAVAQNPAKLTGVCGQLKCCLRYELDYYRQSGGHADRMPACSGCCAANQDGGGFEGDGNEQDDLLSLTEDQAGQD